MKVSSRVERQTRNLTRGLFWISVLLLGVTMFMTGKFGWDSGTSIENKALNALGHGAVDIVGAMLITGSAVCAAWRYRTASVAVLFFALVCIGISALGIFGFLSSNRIAVSKTAEKAESADKDQIDWLRNQTVTKGGSASQRDTFLGEVKAQLKDMKSGHVTAPDAQSEELAEALGWTKQKMNRVLTMLSAGSILFAQFACLWLYGFLRHRIEPDAERSNQSGGSGGTGGGSQASDKGERKFRLVPSAGVRAAQFSKEQAFQSLMPRLAAGEKVPAAKTLCNEWNRPKNTVHTWLKEWGEQGYLARKRSGNSKAIVAGPAHLNGSMGTA